MVGEPTVLIGTGPGAKTAISPIAEIPFPTINIKSKVIASLSGNSSSLNEAITNQNALKKEAKKHGYLEDFSFSI